MNVKYNGVLKYILSKKSIKLLDNLKKYFATTPKEQQNKDWNEIKELNNIDDNGALEYMLKYHKEIRRELFKEQQNKSHNEGSAK